MPVPHAVNGSRWEELDSDEMVAELDAQSRRLLGMPLEDFLKAQEAGMLPESPAVDYLTVAAGALSPREA